MEPHDCKPKRLAGAGEQTLKGLGCNDNVETILLLVINSNAQNSSKYSKE